MFDPILKGIGTFLAWIDSWSGNYMFVLLIFTILVEALFLPLGIKQQKNAIRQAKLRPKEMAIRKKYAGRNDKATQQKVAMEIQELYKQENFNQLSGCLPSLIQLPIILIIYNVVIKPLEYVVKLGSDTITALTKTGTAVGDAITAQLGTGNTGTIKLVTIIKEKGLDFFRQNNFDASAMADLENHYDAIPDFNFLGINLGETPTLAWNWLILVPILTFVIYFLSMKLSRKLTYQPSTGADQQMGCSNKVMDIVMPLFSLFIAFRVPAAIGIYWIYKSIIGTLKQFILAKAMPLPVFTEEDFKAAEKELKGKSPLPERDIPVEAVKSLCHEDDDEEEPYPTFVGTKGGRYDDEDAAQTSAPVEKPEKEGAVESKLTAAPLKDEGTEQNTEDKTEDKTGEDAGNK